MFCPNCHESILGTEKFCSSCGFMLRNPNLYNYQKKEENKQDNSNININKNINKVKKSHNIIIIMAFIFITLSILLILNKDYFFSRGKRTIMVYIVGSDLESKYYSASSDIYEMMTSGADFDNINLLLYTGGSKSWYNDNIDSSENAIYRVLKNEIVKLESYPVSDMGDASTLSTFLNYGFKNYKAEEYSLILWDHGGGPIYGFGLDEHNKLNYLSLLELKSALSSTPFNERNKLEYIGFDACLMSSLEVAYQLRDYANYMIASEEVEPGGGWNYSFLRNITKGASAKDIGIDIINTYNDYYLTNSLVNGTSLALIDLSKVGLVEDKLNDLFKDIDSDLIFNFPSISRSRSITKTYGKTTTISYDLVDLHDLVSSLPSAYDDKKEGLINSLNDLIEYQKTDLDGTNGISIYFPYENKSKLSTIIELYKQFNFASEYTKFIENFANTLRAYSFSSFNMYRTIPVYNNDKIEIELDHSISSSIAKANYLIFEKDSDDYYVPIYRGYDIEVDGDVISTSISNKAIVATDGEGNSINITAFEKERGNDYIKYIIPATLQNWTDPNGSDIEILPVYIEYVVRDGVGNIIGAYEVDENTNLSSKVAIDIYKWKLIQFVNARYKIFDDTGAYTSEWESSSDVLVLECNVDDVQIEFKDFDSDKDLYFMFNVIDVAGEVHNTNVVKINEQ